MGVGDNTFGGVSLGQEQQDGISVLIWPAEDVLAVEHIPGGSVDVVQHLGRLGTQEVQIPVVVAAGDWAGFTALQGTTATLSLIGNATRSATLRKIDRARFFANGDSDFYKAVATFVG